MIEKVIPEILSKQRDLADAAMRFPQHMDALLRAGQWQGLQMALDIIHEIVNEVNQDDV